MLHRTALFVLGLVGWAHYTPTAAAAPSPAMGHCTPDELVLFSCPLQTGSTVSLCASLDLGQGPGLGRMQFRMGALGAIETRFPSQPKSPEFFQYEHETSARSYGDTVRFSTHSAHFTLRDMIGSSHPGEAESNNFTGISLSPMQGPKEQQISCAKPPQASMAQIAKWSPADSPKPRGLTGIELGETIHPAVVYDGPGGKRLGVLEHDPNSNPHAVVRALQIRQDDGSTLVIESMRGTRETSYEIHSLSFFAQDKGYTQVLPHAGKQGLWLKDADTPSEYAAVPWAKFLANLAESVLWHEDLKGLRIHRSPKETASSEVLAEGVYGFAPTGRHKGEWLEVKITGYTNDFTCGGTGKPNGQRWKGWIRGSKSSGEPAVWHYSRGC